MVRFSLAASYFNFGGKNRICQSVRKEVGKMTKCNFNIVWEHDFSKSHDPTLLHNIIKLHFFVIVII